MAESEVCACNKGNPMPLKSYINIKIKGSCQVLADCPSPITSPPCLSHHWGVVGRSVTDTIHSLRGLVKNDILKHLFHVNTNVFQKNVIIRKIQLRNLLSFIAIFKNNDTCQIYLFIWTRVTTLLSWLLQRGLVLKQL
jgi:hypothetical protein